MSDEYLNPTIDYLTKPRIFPSPSIWMVTTPDGQEYEFEASLVHVDPHNNLHFFSEKGHDILITQNWVMVERKDE